jgi:hypothetical protein
MKRTPILLLIPALTGSAASAQTKVVDLATTPYVLRVEGRMTDDREKVLPSVTLRVDTNGVFYGEFQADLKGRFAMDLDIGQFYGITLAKDGFVKKRFIIDARAEDASKVVTGPFHADISLTPEAALENVDINLLDFPYALVAYSRKDKAFVADPTYIEEMKRVESALLLSSAFARKKAER